MIDESHDLNIASYSLKDILKLFNLSFNISTADIKRVKRMVSNIHPDKSNFDPKYFLFYKEAYEIILNIYNEQNKQNKQNNKNTEYVVDDDISSHVMKHKLSEYKDCEFQKLFNTTFDECINNKVDSTKNNWFTDDSNLYDTQITNSTQINEEINKYRSNNNNVIIKQVNNLHSNFGTDIYNNNDDKYVTSTAFEKLQYDDIRRVYRDEIIMPSIEYNENKVIDDYSVDIKPFSKEQSNEILRTQNDQYMQNIMQQQYNDEIKLIKSKEQSKQFLSKFLYLKDK